MDIQLRKHDANIHLILEGDSIFPGTALRNAGITQQTLVETLVKQLDGTLRCRTKTGPAKKVELIFEKKVAIVRAANCCKKPLIRDLPIEL